MSFLSSLRSRIQTIALIAAGTCLAITGTAQAQIGELAGFADSMKREFLNRDLVIITDELEMDTPQRDILESLYEDYRDDFQSGLESMQNSLSGMKEDLQTGDQDRILAMIFAPFEEWREERRILGKSFMTNIKLILSDEQMERWPAFERRMRREKDLIKGTLAGERINLLMVMRNFHLGPAVMKMVEPLLTDYEIALHSALVNRETTINKTQADMIQSLRDQDPRQSVRLADKQVKAHVRVRDVNDQYIEIIAAGLPVEEADRFRDKALQRAYPKAYQTTRGERMYAAAVKIEELESEIVAQIRELRLDLQSELADYSWRIVDAIRDYEPRKEINRVEMYAARKSGERVAKITSPVAGETRRRTETDSRYVHLLRGLLTDEQFKALPGGENWANGRAARKKKLGKQDRIRERDRKRDRKNAANPPAERDESRGVSNR